MAIEPEGTEEPGDIDPDADVTWGDEDENAEQFEVADEETSAEGAAPAGDGKPDPAGAADTDSRAHSGPDAAAHQPPGEKEKGAKDAKPAATPDAQAKPKGSPDGAAPPADASADPPSSPEWEFNADGKTMYLPGSRVTELDGKKGVFLPEDQLRHVERTLADGIHHRGTFREKLSRIRQEAETAKREAAQQVEALRGEVNEEVVRARTYLEHFNALADKGPEAIAEYLDNWTRERPLLEARAERAITQALRDAQKPAAKADKADAAAGGGANDGGDGRAGAAPATREVDPTVIAAELRETIGELCRDPQFAMLAAADQERIAKRLERYPGRFFFFATEHDDENDIEPGDLALNLREIAEELLYERGLLAQTAETAKALAAAETENRKRGLVPTDAPKSAAGAAGTKAPDAERTPSMGMPKTKDEFERFWKLPQDEQDAVIAAG